ncbi:siderophore-interacting protein [Jannaschia marina]|uniref:siderophore-interacting protein n=1 Tax=Jannaschia marina TaxID=2741674 RepID=UPI0015CAD98C|nr:siderophore-interacting protein [Jannaschia marina]
MTGRATLALPGVPFATLRGVIRREALEHGLDLHIDAAEEVSIATPFGTLEARALDDGAELALAASRADRLQTLKETVLDHVLDDLPVAHAALVWSDAPAATEPPPNFRFAEVRKVAPLGTTFLRLRLAVPDIRAFDDSALHFRFLLTPDGRALATSPGTAPNGSLVWPAEMPAPHRPVYTVRTIDRDAGLLTVDVFRHAGGRAQGWAETARPGDRIGLLGPGGGGLPTADAGLNLYGDETAFPAIARIVESASAETRGRVVLRAGAGAACGYPLVAPSGMEVIWHTGVFDLAAQALADRAVWPERAVWFAGEKAEAHQLRAAFKAEPPGRGAAQVGAYWTRAAG